MKILVVYATAGAGHKKAAEALYDGLKGSGHDVVYLDVLKYTNAFYHYSYVQGYTFLVKHLPVVWAAFFGLLDLPWMRPVLVDFRRFYNAVNARAFHDYLRKEQFDCIFSTHFLPNEVAAYLKRTGQIHSKLICCVTDFDVHRIWISKGIDRYAVASPYTREKIISLGVDAQNVHVTGIPVNQKFSRNKNRAELKQKMGLKDGMFTVLMATGSFGFGPIEEVASRLQGLQVLVVCGHNKALYQRMKSRNLPDVVVYGLVDNMDELMAVSDAMITKPGGLSISEALVTGLPLIFFSAIPGQEEHNVRVLARQGVGVSHCPIENMAAVLRAYQSDPQQFQDAQSKAKALGKPDAVKDILSLSHA
ncbi:MAG TPA: glycosyltransferase [Candidatus Omnitrophota bacterium]|nr:glycosyltransferase [Candidatus Omnitrophota bacterium]HSA31003.1 glycosyltransferase [Candidatus Omnitrophota bacterium]